MQESSTMLNLVAQYGYVTIFLIIAVENIEFFGSFPTSLIAAATGAVAAEGIFNPWAAMAVLTIGSITGDVIGYWIGRTFGRPVLVKWGGRMIKNGKLETAEHIVDRYGPWGVFATRWVFASFQAIINIITGITRMHFGKFFLACFLGELLWSVGYFLLGYFFWTQVSGILQKISSLGIFGVILTLLVLTAVYLLYRFRKRIFKQSHDGNPN
ncbi:MAG: DedA family protein [Patescibacteria group bacterium]|jgi:membrane protein DedA with SNARE-associated domain